MYKYDLEFTLTGAVLLREQVRRTQFNAISKRTAAWAEQQMLAHASPIHVLERWCNGGKLVSTWAGIPKWLVK